MSTTPVLCYWDIHGLAQPARLLLTYTGTEFEDKKLSCGPTPDFDKSCWIDNKFSLGLDFPFLPYYIDGDMKITHSNAILRHIARKHDLVGKTDKEKVMADMMADQAIDFRNGWVRLCNNSNFENVKDDYLKTLPKTLQMFSDFLGSKSWFAGDSLTYVDFHMYELLDQHKQLMPNCMNELENMTSFMLRFESLPKIAEYMKSDKFIKASVSVVGLSSGMKALQKPSEGGQV